MNRPFGRPYCCPAKPKDYAPVSPALRMSSPRSTGVPASRRSSVSVCLRPGAKIVECRADRAGAGALGSNWRELPIERIHGLRRNKNLTAHLERLLSHLQSGYDGCSPLSKTAATGLPTDAAYHHRPGRKHRSGSPDRFPDHCRPRLPRLRDEGPGPPARRSAGGQAGKRQTRGRRRPRQGCRWGQLIMGKPRSPCDTAPALPVKGARARTVDGGQGRADAGRSVAMQHALSPSRTRHSGQEP